MNNATWKKKKKSGRKKQIYLHFAFQLDQHNLFIYLFSLPSTLAFRDPEFLFVDFLLLTKYQPKPEKGNHMWQNQCGKYSDKSLHSLSF